MLIMGESRDLSRIYIALQGWVDNMTWANFGCIFTTEDPFLLHNRALKEIPCEILMQFDGSYFIVGLFEVVKPGEGSRVL